MPSLASEIYAACAESGLIDKVSITPKTGGDSYFINAEISLADGMHFAASAMSGDYIMTFATVDGQSIRSGDTVTHLGQSYRVAAQPKRNFDGGESVASLREVS